MHTTDEAILDERDMDRRLMVVTILALQTFSSAELAAFNLAASWNGRVEKTNIAYNRCVESALVHREGHVLALEETKRALAVVITERIKAGTFV